MENLGYYNGKYDLIENMTVPMNDRVCYFGDGVYDVTMCRNYIPILWTTILTVFTAVLPF